MRHVMPIVVLAALVGAASVAAAQSNAAPIKPRAAQAGVAAKAASATPGGANLTIDGVGTLSAPLQIVVLLTLLTFVPAVLVTMTCFTRIVIVFHFLRQAIGTQEMPSNQILIGLALFLTMFIMAPVGETIHAAAVQPVLEGEIDVTEGLARATPPLKAFMLRQTRQLDLALFVRLSRLERAVPAQELPMQIVIPAYVISELKTGFQMGFFLFVPFLLIDFVVSTTILSMGMMQLPPAIVSLPFKVLLFVMIDGWNLVVGAVVRSFF